MASHAHHGPVRTRWVGWVFFAGIFMILTGIVQLINGLVELFRSNTVVVLQTGMATLSYHSVGWSFLILGVVLIAVGAGVMTGKTWARTLAIILITLSVLANLTAFAASPLWSAIVIVLDVIVIYALAAHGKEVRRAS